MTKLVDADDLLGRINRAMAMYENKEDDRESEIFVAALRAVRRTVEEMSDAG